jgi:hypothetical protein
MQTSAFNLWTKASITELESPVCEVVKMFGFIKNPNEACVYKKVSGSAVAFLVLYVDGILLIGNNVPLLNKVKDYLKSKFSMKDLGGAA